MRCKETTYLQDCWQYPDIALKIQTKGELHVALYRSKWDRLMKIN